MDTEQLRALVAVAEAGSLAGAARRLGQPKSTLAKRLSLLEGLLNVRLLERGRRSVRLTDEASRLIDPVRDLLARAEDIAQMVRPNTEEPSGRLRVSMPALLGQTLLPAIIARFVESHPRINLSITADDRYVDLVAEGYDCAIRTGPGNDPDLTRRKLGSSTLILVSSASSGEFANVEHPAAIDAMEAIAFETQNGQTHWRLSRRGEHFDLKPRVRLVYRSLPAIRRTLGAYRAMALLPRFLVRDDIAAGRLIHLCPEWQGDTHEISVVFPSRTYMPLRLRAFIDHLVTEFRRLEL